MSKEASVLYYSVLKISSNVAIVFFNIFRSVAMSFKY